MIRPVLVLLLGCVGLVFWAAPGVNADIKYGSGRYFLLRTPLNHAQAENACIHHGGTLAQIYSKDEQDEAMALAKRYRHSVWTDGIRSGPHSFKWESTDEPIWYSAWWRGEPNNYRHIENCIELRKG